MPPARCPPSLPLPQGLFLGEPAEALQLLRAAGLLERLDSEPVATPDTSDVATNVSAGFLLKGFPSFYEMAAEQVGGLAGRHASGGCRAVVGVVAPRRGSMQRGARPRGSPALLPPIGLSPGAETGSAPLNAPAVRPLLDPSLHHSLGPLLQLHPQRRQRRLDQESDGRRAARGGCPACWRGGWGHARRAARWECTLVPGAGGRLAANRGRRPPSRRLNVGRRASLQRVALLSEPPVGGTARRGHPGALRSGR